MARFTRTKCDCTNCPLQDRKRVRGISGADSFKVAIIGEAPGEEEDQKGEPFVGSAGHKLKEAVASAGLIWHLVYKTNVLLCRPPDNEIDSIEGQLALKCCMPGFKEEVAWMEKNGTKVLVPTGNTSMNALGIEGKIGKYRGSVFEVGKMIAVPTYHPSFILRGMWKEEPTWINDLAKARDLSLKKWTKPKENFNLFPTEKDVKDFVENAIAKDLLVACDLETTSLNEYYAKILMVGLAINGEEAIVVPFTKKGGSDYWSVVAYGRIWKLLDRLFTNCRIMFQNASYDALILATQGHNIKRIEHDTLLLHHCISPELPHNLGYIVSVYGKTPYWKEVVLGSEDKMIGMDDAEVRTYNARDTVVLHQVLPEMIQHLREVGTENIYREVSMNLIKPLMRMHMNGLALDKGRLKKKATQFKKEATRAENELRKLCGLPEAFNFDSGDHMRLLIHGERPKSWNATKAALEAYDVNKKLRRDTKKYAALVAKWDVFTGITPLNEIDGEQIIPPGRDSSVDAMSMLSLERKAILAIQSLDKLKNQTERVRKKREAYERIRKFIQLHRKYSSAHILSTTFSGFPTGPDGRVHLPFKIHGTKTGRLSSGSDDDTQKINGQNIPEEVQDVFVAGPGRSIVKWDYSNIEYRVMAMMTGEKELEARFDAGENFHDINTRLLFGIEKDHPQWDVYRRAAKTFIFGLSYGGTTNGIYSKILVKVPEMNLSLTQFTKIVNDYFGALPNYKKWREMITKQAVSTRCVETAFGRKRFLLGMPGDIEREALNTPIQGTAGEVLLRALIDLDEILLKKFPDAMLVDTVHDSILADVKDADALAVAKLGKKVMERPFKLFGREVRFPVDTEIGPSWGETEKVDSVKELSAAELAAVALGPEEAGPKIQEALSRPEPYDEEAVPKNLRNWVDDYGDKAIPKGKGFITDFVYYTRGYMVPTLACIWSALFVLSSAIKREAWVKFGPLSLFANLYMIIIGTAGRTKKTTAITQLGMPILQGFRSYITDKNLYDMKFINITKDMSTTEALLDTMLPEKKPGEDFFFVDEKGDHILGADGKAVVYRKTSETAIIVSELSTFLNDTSYSDKTTALMLDLYDCHPVWEWKTLGRGKKFLKNLFTTFVAGTTVEGLRESIPKAAKGDGFLSRTIMVYVPSSKRKYAMPRAAYGAPNLVDMQQRLAWIAQHGIGEFALAPDAAAEYERWYDWFYSAMEANPGIEGAISRMDVHLLKIALLIRVSRYEEEAAIITKADLMDAMMLLDATFVNLPFLLGQVEPDMMLVNLSKIELRLRSHPEGISKWILGGSLRLKSDMLHAVLDELTARGQIEFLLKDPKTNELVRHERSTRKSGEIIRWIGDSYDGSAETLGGGEVSYFNRTEEIRKRKKSIKTPGCEPYEPVPMDEGEQAPDAAGIGGSPGGDATSPKDETEGSRRAGSVGKKSRRGDSSEVNEGDS